MATTLGGLFGPSMTPEEEERKQREEDRRTAQMSPMDYFAFSAMRGARGAVGGLGRMAGIDTRTPAEKNAAAIERVKARVKAAGFDPDDLASIDQFYRNVIRILQAEGFPAEALAVAKEYQEHKLASRRVAATEAGIEQRREAARLRAQAAKDSLGQARAALERKGPEFLQLVDKLAEFEAQLATMDDADPRRATVEAAIRNVTARLNTLAAGKGIRVVKTNDRYEVVDAATGAVIREGSMGQKPEAPGAAEKREAADAKLAAAYTNAKNNIQQTYDAAVKLYNAPGLTWITGRHAVVLDREDGVSAVAESALPDAGRAALALYRQVRGGTFLSGLSDLKRESERGSTGLGQVTEREGAKVESAKAALSLSQPTESFRENLRTYIRSIESASDELDAAAARNGIEVRPLVRRALGKAPAASAEQAPAERPTGQAPAGKKRLRYNPATGELE